MTLKNRVSKLEQQTGHQAPTVALLFERTDGKVAVTQDGVTVVLTRAESERRRRADIELRFTGNVDPSNL